MNKQRIIISIGLGIVVITAAFFAVFGSSLKNLVVDSTVKTVVTSDTPSKTLPVVKKPTPVPTSTQSSGYTMTDVRAHNSATSCYSAVNGSVYDLTGWVNSHPGGRAAILMICGKDGSPLFNAQHSGSNKVAKILVKYKIGDLN